VARYGVASVFEALASTSTLSTQNATALGTIVARFLSFASFELPRSLRQSAEPPMEILRQSPWLIPLVLALGILGLVQPLLILFVLFRPGAGEPCRTVRRLAVATMLLIWGIFSSRRAPRSPGTTTSSVPSRC
jgi:hypothetical protein